MDEQKTTRIISENDTDRTIVIPRDETGAAPATPAAHPEPNTAPVPPPNWTRHSILGDLGQFLFPHHRTVVDETIELIRNGKTEEDKEDEETADFTEHLADVHDRYDIAEKPFAEGGQGRISKAVDRALGCEIAMKSLHSRLCGDDHARGDFLNEAKLTASLDHPATS